ncbi:hypothetical protein GUJ93_ZPchr0002g26246 [Zizania palustris]|uniref:Uncharacterized protein n=1 Tax=Zizania palustris TaxID=103762 RepID=A0A8J5VRG7_ZIZPA|nr:hypothetical protein GUJ93_ZPchr0002g26246 [Zizania palustris]
MREKERSSQPAASKSKGEEQKISQSSMKTLQLAEEEEAVVPSPWRECGFTAFELEVAEQLVIFSESWRTSSTTTCRRMTTAPSAELSPPPASRSSSQRSVSVTDPDAPSLPLPAAVKKQVVKDEGMARLAAAPQRRPKPMRYRLITEIYETTKEIKGCNEREEEEEEEEDDDEEDEDEEEEEE